MLTNDMSDRAATLRELAPQGAIRFALNHGNVVLVTPGSTEEDPSGITIDLAREFARRLDAPLRFVHHSRAVDVAGTAGDDRWDVCFLAVDPGRAETIAFSDPYLTIEGAYVVSETSPAHSPADVERLALKVGVTRGSAYALFLRRELKRASLVEFETPALVIAALTEGSIDAVAGVREFVALVAAEQSGLRVIAEPFMAIHQAMGVRTGRPLAQAALQGFVQDIKAEGFLAQVVERHRSGQAS